VANSGEIMVGAGGLVIHQTDPAAMSQANMKKFEHNLGTSKR